MNQTKVIFGAVALLALGLISFNGSAQEGGDAAAPVADGHVARAMFTSGVQNREPVDTLTRLGNDKRKIYFFTELSGLGGQTVTHRWEYQGKTMGEVQFAVGGPRWRVWSSKTLLPQWTGEWRVSVIDGAGNTLAESSFDYIDTSQ